MFLSVNQWFKAGRKTSPNRRRCSIGVSRLEGRMLLAGDITAPITSAALIGVAGQDGYFRGPVTVNLSASDVDDTSNTLSTFSSVNSGPLVAGNSINLTGDGIYQISYFSKDPAGNVEATHTQLVHIDQTAPTITAFASPTTLFPPNHKFVPITVTGHVADNLSGVAHTVTFHVVDEYGQVQPSGTALVDANGNYNFVVNLQASRHGQDKNGRQYVIDVTVGDIAGNQATTAASLVVLHDRGHNGGQDPHHNGESGHHGNNGKQNHGEGNDHHGNKEKQNHGGGNGHHGNSDHGMADNNNAGHGNGHQK